ncbi:MAG: hypothetical protein ABIS34_04670 [Opitutus sp.]
MALAITSPAILGMRYKAARAAPAVTHHPIRAAAKVVTKAADGGGGVVDAGAIATIAAARPPKVSKVAERSNRPRD